MEIVPVVCADKGPSPITCFFFMIPFSFSIQGDRAAGWKTAGDESYAPRGPARPLQRPAGRAEAHGPQLV